MRRTALMLAVVLLLGMPVAKAELGSRLDLNRPFERYAGYVMDEDSGEWSARGLMASNLARTIEQGDAAGSMGGGLVALLPGVRGNRELSLMEPVLTVHLLRGSPIGAKALSIATGGVRYDFVLDAKKDKIGSYASEVFALPLGEVGIEMLTSFAEEGGEVRVYGDKVIYRTDIRQRERQPDARRRIEALSIAAAWELVQELADAEYGLWDLSEAHWHENRPKWAATPLDDVEYGGDLPTLEPGTMLLDAQKSAAVRQYQQLLKGGAFLSAKATGNWGKATREATAEAQRYFGLLPSGMPDRALILRLAERGSGEKAQGEADEVAVQMEDGMEMEPGVLYQADGALSIRLDRVWYAPAIAPSQAEDGYARIYPADRSNRLCVFDGVVINMSDGAMQLPLVLSAEVRVGGAVYACQVRCEMDEGRSFGYALLPGARARLVLCAEVPVEAAGGVPQLTLRVSAESGPIELKR